MGMEVNNVLNVLDCADFSVVNVIVPVVSLLVIGVGLCVLVVVAAPRFTKQSEDNRGAQR